MKLFIFECTEDELKANRGIMDAIVDVYRENINSFFGTMAPCQTKQNDEPQESEDKE